MYFFETDMSHKELERAKQLQSKGEDWRGYRKSDDRKREENEGW